MSTPLSPLGLLLGAVAAVAVCIVLTWLCSKWWYGRQLATLSVRARKHDQLHAALIAKQQNLVSQVDSLRSELRSQKALAVSMSARAEERDKLLEPLLEPTAQMAALNEPVITSRGPKKPPDFEDTQIL